MGQDGAFRLQPFYPFQRLTQGEMARMRPWSQGVQNPDVETSEQPFCLGIKAAHIGRIGETGEAERQRRDTAVNLADRQGGEGAPLPCRWSPACPPRSDARWRSVDIRFQAVSRSNSRSRPDPCEGRIVGVDIDAAMHVHDEPAQVVDAVDVVSVRVRVEHAIHLPYVRIERLLTKIRTGIDENVCAPAASFVRRAASSGGGGSSGWPDRRHPIAANPRHPRR